MRPLSAADLPGLSGRFAAASVAYGRQKVAKHRDADAARNTVEVFVANIRLPEVGTDMLVTVNRPCFISEGSSTVPQTGSGTVAGDAKADGSAVLRTVLQTFCIKDWGLFG